MIAVKVHHLVHCFLFVVFTFWYTIIASSSSSAPIDPWQEYGIFITLLLYITSLQIILAIPALLFLFSGLIKFDVFPEKVQLNGCPTLAPFICFRVVTRGDYPSLVSDNVARNMETCQDVGLEHFIIEVVTDKRMNINQSSKLREIVVPIDYKTKTGALYKARALQYCLEDDVNNLNGNDWIVHLDEETLMSEDSVRGILNFVMDGRHKFGQGLITYAHGNVVNWMTTLIDNTRVADDMGKIRFTLKALNKPWFGIKGSFIVSQLEAERDVSYENGPQGSITEDAFFAMKAMDKGYSFDWIEGEMFEKSPFTFMDFVRQRMRWVEGLLLNVHSDEVSIKHRLLVATQVYSNLLTPLMLVKLALSWFYPLTGTILDQICFCLSGFSIYTVLFGLIKSIPPKRQGIVRYAGLVLGSLAVLPLNLLSYAIAVTMLAFSPKRQFYIVQK